MLGIALTTLTPTGAWADVGQYSAAVATYRFLPLSLTLEYIRDRALDTATSRRRWN
jgi:hypothetical protein